MMKRRKRKMRLLAAGGLNREFRSVSAVIGHAGSRLGVVFSLAGALACVALLQPHMVNPTSTSTHNAARVQENQSARFDDEPNFREREFANLKRLSELSQQQQQQQQEQSPSQLPVIKMISADNEPRIKPHQVDEREQPPALPGHDLEYQHLGDLLAIESSRSPATLGAPGRLAPYETSGTTTTTTGANMSPPRYQNLSSPTTTVKQHQQQQKNSLLSSISDTTLTPTTHLLRLTQAHAPLEPIYLKHHLLDAGGGQLAPSVSSSSTSAAASSPLKPRQIVAFPHPAAAASGHTSQAGHSGSYALLPSWPNIYIAQRERPAPPTQAPITTTTTAPSILPPPADPKVPMSLPEWSRARQELREHRENTTAQKTASNSNSALQEEVAAEEEEAHARVKLTGQNLDQISDRQQRKRTNLTASEVEYEVVGERHHEQNERTGDLDETTTTRDSSNNKETADAQWARLLRQAAAGSRQQPVMFTNRSIVSLFCDTHHMLISLKFRAPFYGSVETTNHLLSLDSTNTATRGGGPGCRLFGNGSHLYEMRIGLLECGTRQEMPRLFLNNVQIQFRSNNSRREARLEELQQEASRARLTSLEQLQLRELLEARLVDEATQDELKTLICSYPPPSPPLAPPVATQTTPAGGRIMSNGQNNLLQDLNTPPRRPDSIAFGGGGGGRSPTGDVDLPPLVRPSDRIIDITSVDDPASSARPAYYEPALLIAGLLLLAVACTLALVSSAYLARRHRRRRSHPAGSLASRAATTTRETVNYDARGPVYRVSPSQLANRSGGSPLGRGPVVKPPLIGLSKEELLDLADGRPTGKKYSTAAQRELQRSNKQPAGGGGTTTKRRAHLRNSSAAASKFSASSASTTTSGDSLESGPARNSGSVSTIEIPLVVVQPAGARTDLHFERAKKRVVEHEGPTSATQQQQASKRPALVRPEVPSKPTQAKTSTTTTTTTTREEYTERLVEKTSATSHHQGRPQSATPEAAAAATTLKAIGGTGTLVKQEEVAPSASPPPFGSLRAKLTSPLEFARLQGISRLFGDSLKPAEQLHELQLRYRNKIARTLSDRERLDMRKLFQHDELFRSSVVDSLDADETFWRKLRNNPKYAGKFSPAAWALLQEIVLNAELTRPALAAAAAASLRPEPVATRLDGLFSKINQQAQGQSQPARLPTVESPPGDKTPKFQSRPSESGQHRAQGQRLKVTNLDGDHDESRRLWRPSGGSASQHQRDSQRPLAKLTSPLRGTNGTKSGGAQQTEAKMLSQQRPQLARDQPARAGTGTQVANSSFGDNRHSGGGGRGVATKKTATHTPVRGDPDTGAIRVSQSNSSRTRQRDGSTMINFDSVTNISTPRNYASRAFTRSSFEQVTRYQEEEEDSLPWMDEFSASSIDEAQSFSSSSLDNNNKRPKR